VVLCALGWAFAVFLVVSLAWWLVVTVGIRHVMVIICIVGLCG